MDSAPSRPAFSKRALVVLLAVALAAAILAPASTAAAQNAPPIADAGRDRSVALGTRIVNLDASRSIDIDGSFNTLTFRWEVVTPTYVNSIIIIPTGTPLGSTAQFLAPNAAEAARFGYSITFRLTVTDPWGLSDTEIVTFSFERRPNAKIDVVALLADPNATDTDGNGTIDDDERYTVNAVLRRPGQGGNSNTEWTVREGARLTLKSTGNPAVGGLDPTTLTYFWRKLSDVPRYAEFNIPANERDDQEFTVDLPNALRQGQTAVVHYTLSVSNAVGLQANATVRINVVDEAFDPEVTLALFNTLQPVQDANTLNPDDHPLRYAVDPGDTVQLIARGVDRDANQSRTLVHTWAGTGVTPNPTNPTRGANSRATFTAPSAASRGQTYAVQVLVTDDTGRIGRDQMVFIVADNTPPVATAPLDDVTEDGPRGGTNRQGLVILTGIGTDADGDTLSYRWAQVDVNGTPLEEPTVELMNANTATVSFVPPEAPSNGILEIHLAFTVIDQWGVSDTDTMIMTILGQNLPPEADAGPNQIVRLGTTVRLDGTGSSDPDANSRVVSWLWEQTGFATTPPQSERPITRFDELALAGYLPIGNVFPDVLVGANSPVPYFDTPSDIGGYSSVQFTFTLTVRDSSRAHDTDTVTITVIGDYFSGVITGPDFCANRSLGGPPTYPHDVDRDGVADQCSLRTTRREAVARQNALTTLASLNLARFRTLVVSACDRVTEDFGEDPAKLANDVCATSQVSDPPPPVPPNLVSQFFSGPVVTGPDFCTNFSLGGARLYPFDLPPEDGVADICVLPYTRREAIARQHALEFFATPVATFNNALALACRELGSTDFGDEPAKLAQDACAS